MKTETHDTHEFRHGPAARAFLATALVLAGAVAATWAWNTIVTDLAGLARFRFAEGLAIALATVLFGALFETGRALARELLAGRHRTTH